ncbi:MAG: hypothetical protein ABFD01_00300 [Candidatus Cloacimonas sp.]
MGTQQILLIVLSVIIVGAAIAVGITMFNNQSYTSNKAAIAADAQNFATQVVQYYKTPDSQGGADRNMTNMKVANISSFIGWGATTTTTENGEYALIVTDNNVYVLGLGKETKGNNHPAVRTTIAFPAGTISAKVIDTVKTTAASLVVGDFGS